MYLDFRCDSEMFLWCSSCVLMVSVFSLGREFLEFAQLGVSTNWFGLGCPIHCGQPSWFSLGLVFLLGLLLGSLATVAIGAFLLLRLRHLLSGPSPFCSSSSSPSRPPDLALDRLRGYLHGWQGSGGGPQELWEEVRGLTSRSSASLHQSWGCSDCCFRNKVWGLGYCDNSPPSWLRESTFIEPRIQLFGSWDSCYPWLLYTALCQFVQWYPRRIGEDKSWEGLGSRLLGKVLPWRTPTSS